MNNVNNVKNLKKVAQLLCVVTVFASGSEAIAASQCNAFGATGGNDFTEEPCCTCGTIFTFLLLAVGTVRVVTGWNQAPAASYLVLSDGLYDSDTHAKVTTPAGYTFTEIPLSCPFVTSLPTGCCLDIPTGKVALPTGHYLSVANIRNSNDDSVCRIPDGFNRINGQSIVETSGHINGTLQIIADVASLPSGSSIDTTTGNVALPAGYSFDLTNFYYNGVSTSNPIPSDFLTAASRENILTKDDGSTFGLGAIISRRNENIGIIGRINLAFMRWLFPA